MYILILLNPLIGAILAGILGRNLGVKGSQYITTGLMLLTTFITINQYYEVAINKSPISIIIGSWLTLNGMIDENYSISFDALTVSMLIPIIWISTMVHIYSIGYMNNDPHQQRFFCYLSMFTFWMLLLVTSDNLLLQFAGWEGVGISSYLLINFWFTRIQANQAALKAFLMNRFGDQSLTQSLLLLLTLVSDMSQHFLFSIGYLMNKNLIFILTIFILIGAIAKSAQFGLHTWLPDAMEGKYIYTFQTICIRIYYA